MNTTPDAADSRAIEGLGAGAARRLVAPQQGAVGWRFAFWLGWLALVVSPAGCAVLRGTEIHIDGTLTKDSAEVARIAVHPGKPVLLRAVDEEFLASIQVSNYLRPITYVLTPGRHVLWLSEVPAGIPFIPQHINCFTMLVTLVAGKDYDLELGSPEKVPTLRRSDSAEEVAVGVLVDRAFLMERGCRWQ